MLQMLATQFEHLKIEKDESIVTFNAKMKYITNQAFQLGKRYSNVKHIQKTLRSFRRRFEVKVGSIN